MTRHADPVAILFDLGDTLMDESTEVKDGRGTTLSADLFPGTAEALNTLAQRGYRLALVADAYREGPRNVLRQHGLLDLFETLSISEDVGIEKPAPEMFHHALETLGIPQSDYPRVVMVGNNLERDVVGANRLGIRSVFFHANERRRTRPISREEAPRHTVYKAAGLVDLIEQLSIPLSGDVVPTWPTQDADYRLALKHAPVICFDRAEPFMPEVIGYTVSRREAQSPSFYRWIERGWRPAWETAIEYAIWWDWDIQHLYELEHVWVYLDGAGRVVLVEASSHGSYATMQRENGVSPLRGERPIVYSQPGKHAFAPGPHWFTAFRDSVALATGEGAGSDGVLIKAAYAREVTPEAAGHAAVNAWLRQRAFEPTFHFDRIWEAEPARLLPWPVLDRWIPRRLNEWLRQLGG